MNASVRVEPAIGAVADLIGVRTGLVFPPSRRSDVELGTRKIMAKAGITDPVECLKRLETDSFLLDDLIAELTIGETYFFRDPSDFSFIREVVVPEVRRRRGAEHVLRVWSAGCASGEEPYSLAILFEEAGLVGRAEILATDISRTALARAQKAAYGTWSLRGEGARLIGQYLRRSGGHFELAERFRGRVTFAYLNLAQDAYPTFATNTWGMDLVLCRNVLIYLDAQTIRHVARRLYESLAVDGFLITGPSDPSLADHAPFETQRTVAGVVYRKTSGLNRRIAETPGAPAAPLSPSSFPLLLDGAPETPPMIAACAPIGESHSPVTGDLLVEARDSLARGEHARVVELTRPLKTDLTAAALCVRALANLGDVETAVETAAEAAARHPASLEIGFLLAVLLMNLNRHGEAARALRRVLYLDRSLAVAQFALGTTLHRLGNFRGAVRAYRNAHNLAARRPLDEIMPLSDGEKAGQLAKAAAIQVSLLEPLVDAGK